MVAEVEARFGQDVVFPNGKKAKNRFGVASLTNKASNADGTLNDREFKWLHRRAVDGWGIVNTCCVHVQRNGQGWFGEWGCFDDAQTEGYTRMAKAVQAEGSLFIVQVFHAGMRADDTLFDGPALSCVDTVYKHRAGEREVKAMSEAQIEELIEAFVAAARRLEAAGVDGIELHGAHGYMLTQFFCPTLNKRTDKWGGSLENRARLTREVTRRVRAAVSKDFVVGIRISPEPGYEVAGWDMDPDECVQLAQWAAEDGVDFVSVSVFGEASRITKKHEGRPDARPLVQLFRQALPSEVVLMACGGVRSGAQVSGLLDLGVDVAVCGSTAIGTPDFPKRCIADPTYETTVEKPFSVAHLRTVDTSEPFIEFMQSIRVAQQDE